MSDTKCVGKFKYRDVIQYVQEYTPPKAGTWFQKNRRGGIKGQSKLAESLPCEWMKSKLFTVEGNGPPLAYFDEDATDQEEAQGEGFLYTWTLSTEEWSEKDRIVLVRK